MHYEWIYNVVIIVVVVVVDVVVVVVWPGLTRERLVATKLIECWIIDLNDHF